jgi:hypothetical protein
MSRPIPGSDAAKAQGCVCWLLSIEDLGYVDRATWFNDPDCPLHAAPEPTTVMASVPHEHDSEEAW